MLPSIRRRRSLQRICSVEGLGCYPTSHKSSFPEKLETVIFRIWRTICPACYFCKQGNMERHMHCLLVLLIIKLGPSFAQTHAEIRSNFHKSKISKQCLCLNTLQIGKQCMCGHKHKKSPETAFAERVIFLLVEAPPQSPTNTKSVLKHSLADCGYAILESLKQCTMEKIHRSFINHHRSLK